VDPDFSKKELRAVAKRPAQGHISNFFGDMRNMLSLGTLKATIREFMRDDALGLAAQLAYYMILALFPFILVLFSLMGTFSSPELASTVLEYLRQVMPNEAYGLIEEYTGPIISGDAEAPELLSFGVLFTIWAASGAFSALINALNRAYDVQETRPYWKVKGLAILMTLGLSVLILAGVLLMVLGPSIGVGISDYFGLDKEFLFIWNIVRWPVALLLMVATVALLYFLAPDAGQPFRWITPGGFVGVLLWVVASVAFSVYVNNFGSYNKTYGSIGVVIVLLLYLYISSLTILFGATLNAVLIRLKEEVSGEHILNAQPAGDKPDLVDEELVEEVRDERNQ